MFLVACAPARGTIVGVARDARTKQPLEGVHVAAQHLGDETDVAGAFRIPLLEPGEVEVTAWRRDLVRAHQRVRVLAARETMVELWIDRSPPACCRLAGLWSIRLRVEKSGRVAVPRGTEVTGTITFATGTGDRARSDDPTLDELGSYDVDLRPILGDDLPRKGEASGFVFDLDHLEVTFLPRMADVGVLLGGQIAGDEIRGEWLERAFAPSISGTFVMLRQSK